MSDDTETGIEEGIENRLWCSVQLRSYRGINPLVRANYLASPPLVVAYGGDGDVPADHRENLLAQHVEQVDLTAQQRQNRGRLRPSPQCNLPLTAAASHRRGNDDGHSPFFPLTYGSPSQLVASDSLLY